MSLFEENEKFLDSRINAVLQLKENIVAIAYGYSIIMYNIKDDKVYSECKFDIIPNEIISICENKMACYNKEEVLILEMNNEYIIEQIGSFLSEYFIEDLIKKDDKTLIITSNKTPIEILNIEDSMNIKIIKPKKVSVKDPERYYKKYETKITRMFKDYYRTIGNLYEMILINEYTIISGNYFSKVDISDYSNIKVQKRDGNYDFENFLKIDDYFFYTWKFDYGNSATLAVEDVFSSEFLGGYSDSSIRDMKNIIAIDKSTLVYLGREDKIHLLDISDLKNIQKISEQNTDMLDVKSEKMYDYPKKRIFKINENVIGHYCKNELTYFDITNRNSIKFFGKKLFDKKMNTSK